MNDANDANGHPNDRPNDRPNDLTEPTGPATPPVREPARSRGRIGRLTRAVPRWWPLPVGALAGALCGGVYGDLAPPQYAATSYVVAVPGKDAQPGAAVGFAQAYGRIATSDSTIAYARVAAGMPADRLRSRVRTETSPDSPMIAITGTSKRAGEAADIANAVADAVFVSSNQVAKSTGVQLVSFSQAIPPTRPVSPSLPVAAAVGASAGGLIGGLVMLVRPRPRRGATGVTVPAPAGSSPAGGSGPRPGTGAYPAEMERV
ncbi:lipopolysaccharide biosynthesis protein [Streptomyces sp. NPDC051018]|uniref:lipopolysaccharide biosynthesis protein n=1 Tax=Streptomyces sp. NPDC051018 TaxID=3365639 RepID=UPI003794099A